MSDKNETETHVRTIKDVFDLFEPFLTVGDIQECIDELESERKQVMSDLISRQALCEYALNQKDKSVTPNDIMRFPSIQQEIIRCKDCKHWKSKEFVGNNDVHTINLASLPCKNWLTASDWYCGNAERKEE